ncbi:MAG TPA: PAS domain S-box protein [Bryobacteraceae bacterium]|nr:PAS domain S-box protein [Bryobacteraceae bacterium]
MLISLFRLFDTRGLMPHGMCYQWNSDLIKVHALSDLVIGAAYVAISVTLASFVYRAKRDIPFSWMFVGFGIFIIACGGTHFMEIWTLWTPLYWLSGLLKILTAAASVTVAVALPPLLPKSLALIRAAQGRNQLREELMQANHILQVQIGERQAAEQEILRLNAHLEDLVSARTVQLSEAREHLVQMAASIRESANAIWTLDLEAHITAWNPAAERLFGYCAEEVLGKHASMLAPAARNGEIDGIVERARKGEILPSVETVRRRKSGDLFYVFLAVSAITNAAGELVGVSMMATDITERRRAETMFRVAVEAAPNAMIMVDTTGKIAMVNAQTEKLFGYSRRELIGGNIEMLLPQKFRDLHLDHRNGFMKAPGARAMGAGRDLYAVRKDGSEVPVEIGLNPIETDHGLLVLSAIVDITERKQAEEEIQRLHQGLERRVADRTEELSIANAELEAFSYSVAHDLRAPLRHIAGFSKILAEEYAANFDDQARKYLTRVQDGAQHMGSLVDDLLNLAQIGRTALARDPTSLDKVLRAALEKIEPECAGRVIEWRIQDLGSAECDPGLMQQVFINLLSNAVKFTRHRHPPVIEVGKITKDGEPIYFVRDNGAGFDMAYANKLFGVFQRLHKRQDFEGTGIGLANTHKIIKKHRGRIWAESEVDKGAAFFFTIPDEPVLESVASSNSLAEHSE